MPWLKPDRVRCEVPLGSKKQLLEALVELLITDSPDMDPNSVLNCMYARERVGSTGLCNGVALPHGRLANQEHPVAAFIQLTKGIDYDAPDGLQVDLAFAMVIPAETNGEHRACLSRFGDKLRDVDFSARLRGIKDPAHIYTLLTAPE